jgi:hypothetical protein
MDLSGLQQLLDMARNDEFDVLVVPEVDRLSRDIDKFYTIHGKLKANNITLDFILRDYPDDWQGKFFLYMDVLMDFVIWTNPAWMRLFATLTFPPHHWTHHTNQMELRGYKSN